MPLLLDPARQGWQLFCIKTDRKMCMNSNVVHCFECCNFMLRLKFVLFFFPFKR